MAEIGETRAPFDLRKSRHSFRRWWRSGEPWIWLNAVAVGISITAVLGLVLLIGVRGLAHFWPSAVVELEVRTPNGTRTLLGEIADRETLPAYQFLETAAGGDHDALEEDVERWLVKTGNRRLAPPDFRWVFVHDIESMARPVDAVVVEREEWGMAYGRVVSVLQGDATVASGDAAYAAFQERLERVRRIHDEIKALERGPINDTNDGLERLRLEQRRIELGGGGMKAAAIAEEREALQARYQTVEQKLRDLYTAASRDSIILKLMDGRQVQQNLSGLIRAWEPNAMSVGDKLVHYAQSLWIFLTEDPREANTEGGIFPAIFGTVMMVLLMSVLVTPFGVVAAIYLREYAHQGAFVRLIRIAVNNLAGVPSIVYGVFGLGFFVYLLGGSLDRLFFPESLPAPTFGTPGLLWASLTLALLTVPVVIVSTEEGLTRIPRSLREGSLALGATKAETLFRVVIPMASPSILTGVILAVARAAGEVAPLMLVGVVKLAPTLPVDGAFPYLHLDRKFMHLGFHIYDVGFQSPNVEAARPLVYATALLLVLIIIALNLTAIALRSRLEARYKAVES